MIPNAVSVYLLEQQQRGAMITEYHLVKNITEAQSQVMLLILSKNTIKMPLSKRNNRCPTFHQTI